MSQCFVQQMTWESDDVMVVRLAAVDGSELATWEPGAHVAIELPAGLRHYSLCGDPADLRSYTIAVLREPESRGGSTFVHERLRPGDVVEVRPPANHFALEEADGYRLFAGGVGITPLIAMARELERRGEDWRLLYVGRSEFTMAFVEELRLLAPRAEIVCRDAAPRPDLAAALRAPRPGEAVYVCGPPPFVDAVRRAAAEAGWPDDAVRSERFVPEEFDTAGDRAFSVVCVESGIELEVPANRRLADVLVASGLEVETACREGICGTCRVPVRSGELIHRDVVLGPKEREAGNALMACVSRASGVLELGI